MREKSEKNSELLSFHTVNKIFPKSTIETYPAPSASVDAIGAILYSSFVGACSVRVVGVEDDLDLLLLDPIPVLFGILLLYFLLFDFMGR